MKGLSFGLTSGVITTLGMMVGLYSGTHSELAVIGGVLMIAIADAFSDALGIHVSEESANNHTIKEVWESTITTFLTKFFFALTFIIPLLLFSLKNAIWVSIGWGFFVLGFISYWMARNRKEKPLHIIGEHWLIASIVILITHYVGDFIAGKFGAIM